MIYNMEESTAFVDRYPLKDNTSEAVVREEFGQCFVPNGIPRLVIMNYVITFKGVLLEM